MNTIHQQPVDPNTDVAGCRRSGGFQIVVGLLTLIFGIVSVCIDCEYSYFGTAIWGGVWVSKWIILQMKLPSCQYQLELFV